MKAIVAPLVIVLLACTKAEPAPAPARAEKPAASTLRMPVQTDRPRYQMTEGPFGPQTTIVTTYTAPADKPVYLMNCNGAFSMSLLRQDGNAWVDAWGAEINGCFSEPILIAPGKTHTGTMTVASGVDALVSSRRTESNVPTGVYRAVWNGLVTSFDVRARPIGQELPLEQRMSAPFVIDEAPPYDPARTSPAEQPAELALVEPAHGTQAARDTPMRIRFAPGFQPLGPPHLYADEEPVEYEGAHEYLPRGGWTPGRHELRVVYQDQQRNTRWFAWSFVAR